MHDAGLHDGLGKDRAERLWEAFQTVNHGDENVANASGRRRIYHLEIKTQTERVDVGRRRVYAATQRGRQWFSGALNG